MEERVQTLAPQGFAAFLIRASLPHATLFPRLDRVRLTDAALFGIMMKLVKFIPFERTLMKRLFHRILISLTLCALLTSALVIPASAAAFEDVPD